MNLFKPGLFVFSLFVLSITGYGQLALENAYPNLSFNSPVDYQHAGDGTNRSFVVERSGRIYVFQNNSNVTSKTEYLNITGRVASGGEMGLLGLAFHPDYENNGYFYVNYTADNPRRTVISRFSVTSDPDDADENSEFILLEFDQPYSNHNGGQTSFGPDGFLYIGTGDGGSGGDPQNNAQDKSTLLGNILRIDVDNPQGGLNYGIPDDNPYKDNTEGYQEEIYANGMRNPWRSSWNTNSGMLWCADVGQNQWEEIDIVENGGNYGWRCYEGNHEYNTSGCEGMTAYDFPVWEYSHSNGCSITGGFVYRGPSVTEIYGKYIYSDYCSRTVWSIEYDGITPPTNETLLTAPASVVSFGTDQNQELYILCFDGNIYKFSPTAEIIAPTNLTASADNAGNVMLNWQDNSDNENGFKIERKEEGGEFSVIDSVGENETSFTDQVPQTLTYVYRVIAFNDNFESLPSNEAQVVVTSIPVELISFTANVEDKKVILSWSTSTETNNCCYEVERFMNGNWSNIGYVEGKGTTTYKQDYTFIDDFGNNEFKGTVKYRLKQIDHDGSFVYSNIVTVNLNIDETGYHLRQNYPNPFNPSTTISYNIPEESKVKVEIINVLGKVVDEFVNGIKNAGSYQKTWNASHVSSGIYYIKMKAESVVSDKTYFNVMKMVYLK